MFGALTILNQVALALIFIASTFFIRFLVKLHVYRTRMKGRPGPPHSYLWGHLEAVGEATASLPPDAHPQLMVARVKEMFGLGDIFYLDLFPFAEQALVISDIDVMKSITTQPSLPKHDVVYYFMDWLAGPQNLVSSEGSAWKRWRSAFNPGFSVKHIMSLVPIIVEECQIFCDLMTEKANKHELFRFERAATNVTIDIIGRVVLDISMNSQRGPNTLADSMLSLLRWIPMGQNWMNLLSMLDLRRPIMLRYNTWKLNRYIGRIVEERFAARHSRQNSKVVIDLALDVYVKETKGTEDATRLDPDFKTAAISNMKTFIFAGHDTTSSGVAYALYYLSKYPDILAKTRKEHDDVFGPDLATVTKQLKDDPYLLNKLVYTTAVIREVLRYQPPASTLRGGRKDVFVHHPETGQAFPTEDMMVWPLDVGLHRNEKYWPNPHIFDPDRHLVSPSSKNNSTNNNKEAWVPFSNGPRNCIGQELAMVETKILLLLTVRRFDFAPAFDEVHKLSRFGSGYIGGKSGVRSVYGDEAYQVAMGTAKPREGMPCRLTLRT